MSPQDFCYWLQGFAEISGREPTEAEWLKIKNHLQLVFCKVTPARSEQPEEFGKFKPLDMQEIFKKMHEQLPGIDKYPVPLQVYC